MYENPKRKRYMLHEKQSIQQKSQDSKDPELHRDKKIGHHAVGILQDPNEEDGQSRGAWPKHPDMLMRFQNKLIRQELRKISNHICRHVQRQEFGRSVDRF